jgi:hypothetical protein
MYLVLLTMGFPMIQLSDPSNLAGQIKKVAFESRSPFHLRNLFLFFKPGPLRPGEIITQHSRGKA